MKLVAALIGFLVLVGSVGAVVWMQPAAKSDYQKREEIAEELPEVEPEGPQPKVEVEPSRVHTFEPMRLGETGSHVFTIKNVGEGTLNLKKLGSTCKCTLSDLEDTSIEPGESIDVTLEWTPKAMAEEFLQKAMIKTNDLAEEQLDLIVQGPVKLEVVLKPGPVWDVGTISEDLEKPTTYKGAVGSQLKADFEVVGVRSGTGAVTAEFEPLPPEMAEEAGTTSGSLITITVAPTVAVGRFSEEVVFETNLESTPEVPITVMGTRSGPFSILGPGWLGARSRLDLNSFPAAKGLTRTLTMFVDKGEEPLELSNVRVVPDLLEVSLEKDESFENKMREKYTLSVTVPPGVRPGVYDGDEAVIVEADANHPRFDSLNFMVKFTALPE